MYVFITEGWQWQCNDVKKIYSQLHVQQLKYTWKLLFAWFFFPSNCTLIKASAIIHNIQSPKILPFSALSLADIWPLGYMHLNSVWQKYINVYHENLCSTNTQLQLFIKHALQTGVVLIRCSSFIAY